MTAPTFGIHWFRRDLRLSDNPALLWSLREHQGRVLGLFIFDSRFLARPDFSPDRFAFFLSALSALKAELREAGGDLLVLDGGPETAFARLFEAVNAKGRMRAVTVSFNRDYEPFARMRDTRAAKLLAEKYGVTVHHERDHLLLEPHEVLKDDGEPYRVFTPYSRAWWAKFRTSSVQARIRQKENAPAPTLTLAQVFGATSPLTDMLEEFGSANAPKVRVPIPLAGEREARKQVRAFKKRLEAYATERDLPALDGTSRLSIFLKNGSLTPAQIIAALELDRPMLKAGAGPAVFLKELVWREFYYSILYHFPNVENEAFNGKFRSIDWPNDEALFAAWREGQTGFPIVDAGMRQLNQTGWMHNRVRMIVASFLVKDLLIDWRWGERHFMNRLLDGDLAANNGGWQWSASTGCDSQPYFRIFNPALQSKRFDPDGTYIRRYVPELARASAKEIHAPKNPAREFGYREPIVDHSLRREKALALFKNA
ncbi:MAG TPA: deoxyribodipyrimidine photo-lyase [Bdellovibrionales bacterium]|nr:deoxyribodipyrimidine photo-lyase [Bdellovibrionales bacterium]